MYGNQNSISALNESSKSDASDGVICSNNSEYTSVPNSGWSGRSPFLVRIKFLRLDNLEV